MESDSIVARPGHAGAPSAGVFTCDRSLEGRPISVDYPLFNPSLATVVQYAPLEGSVRITVLPPAPRRPKRSVIALGDRTNQPRRVTQPASGI